MEEVADELHGMSANQQSVIERREGACRPTRHARVTIPYRKWPILAGLERMSRRLVIFDCVAGKCTTNMGLKAALR